MQAFNAEFLLNLLGSEQLQTNKNVINKSLSCMKAQD